MVKLSKKFKKVLKQYFTYSAIFLGILLLFLVFKINPIQIVMVIFLIIIASFSKIYQRWTSMSLGFELITLVTIFFSYKIGIVFGMGAGLFMMIASEFMSGKLIPNKIIHYAGTYILIALLAGALTGVDFIVLAIALTILRNLLVFFGGLPFGAPVVKTLIGTVLNIFINIFLIVNLGPFILTLL